MEDGYEGSEGVGELNAADDGFDGALGSAGPIRRAVSFPGLTTAFTLRHPWIYLAFPSLLHGTD